MLYECGFKSALSKSDNFHVNASGEKWVNWIGLLNTLIKFYFLMVDIKSNIKINIIGLQEFFDSSYGNQFSIILLFPNVPIILLFAEMY